MGKNINQILTAASSVLSTDKLYIGRSPFGLTDDRYILGSSLIQQFSVQSGSSSLHTPVDYASTGGYTATYNNGASGVGATLTNSGALAAFSIDGVVPLVGQRVLLSHQASSLQNGIYVVTIVGSGAIAWVLTRATDFDSVVANEVQNGALIPVTSGQVSAGFRYIFVTTGVIVVGVTGLLFIVDVSDLGLQRSSNAIITGGIINGTVIGGVTRAAGSFTDILAKTLGFDDTAFPGLTLKNLTTVQVNAVTPAQGNLVADTTLTRAKYYNGASWNQLAYLTDITSLGMVTVGTGGNYATYADAFTAGAFNLIQISNVTETADFTFNSGTSVVVNIENPLKFTTTFGTFSAFQVTNGTNLSVAINSFNASYAYVVDKSLFACLDAASSIVLVISHSTITNSSIAGLTFSYILGRGAGAASCIATNCIFNLNNGPQCGFDVYGVGFTDVQFIGGGAACAKIVNVLFAAGITNLIIQGTFATLSIPSPHFTFVNSSISGMIFIAGADILISTNNCSISNIQNAFSGNTYILVESQTCEVSNSNLGSGGFILEDGVFLSASNCSFEVIDETPLTTLCNVRISNSDILNNITLGSTGNSIYQITNTNFKLDLAISCDFARISNCTVGQPGGVQTLTVNASANKTTLIGNASNVAIVNNGTNTELVSNTTF